jgi:hypothetical protein
MKAATESLDPATLRHVANEMLRDLRKLPRKSGPAYICAYTWALSLREQAKGIERAGGGAKG